MFLIITASGSPLCWRAGMDGVETDTPILFETVALAAKWLMPGDRVVSCRVMSEGERPGD